MKPMSGEDQQAFVLSTCQGPTPWLCFLSIHCPSCWEHRLGLQCPYSVASHVHLIECSRITLS